MDQSTSERYLESKEELQKRMDETRHSMADTVGQIRQEFSQAVNWQTYVQRYPGACLLAGGALGWAIGRRLGALQHDVNSAFTFHEALPVQPVEPSTISRMAEMVASSVFAQALPVLAAKMRQFLAASSSSVRE
ncbi:MAG: hypothetical protein L0387_43400 [Acidobacteria bacterium]|nr:hypothetical protein [Acidobacteriota bacterium]MCI0724067.1 hypothetical protein [Acidobacteriota bacterium]